MLGKKERQGHLDTLISNHSINDLAKLRLVVPIGSLLVRINPLNPESSAEIERVIADGADIVMLPMYQNPEDVMYFTELVGGRAKTCLLVETISAMNSLAECVQIPGVDEVHIGLNDLHLELGTRFMFEALADGLVDDMAHILREASVPFGFGGVARAGEGLLAAEFLLGEHARLGSTAAILSRTFHRQANTIEEMRTQFDFAAEISKLRRCYSYFANASVDLLQLNRHEVTRSIHSIVEMLGET